jgi:hypothetical protein
VIGRGARHGKWRTPPAFDLTVGIADCGTSLPEQDAIAVDPENPRRFLRSTKWKKAMDGFFHGQIDLQPAISKVA